MEEYNFTKGGSVVTLSDGGKSKLGIKRMKLTQWDNSICYYDYGDWGEACNAVFYGNKILFFFFWNDVSDKEIAAILYQDIKLVICPFRKSIQFIIKPGNLEWSDVICHYPGPQDYNRENKPVGEIDFILADVGKDEIVAVRKMPLPNSLAAFFMERCDRMMQYVKTNCPEAYRESHSEESVKQLEQIYGADPKTEWYHDLEDRLHSLFSDEAILSKYPFDAICQVKGTISVTVASDVITGIEVCK